MARRHSDPLLVRIDEIHEAPDIVTVTEAGLFPALLEPLLRCRIVGSRIIRDRGHQSAFLGVGLRLQIAICRLPIADGLIAALLVFLSAQAAPSPPKPETDRGSRPAGRDETTDPETSPLTIPGPGSHDPSHEPIDVHTVADRSPWPELKRLRTRGDYALDQQEAQEIDTIHAIARAAPERIR